MLSGTDLKNVLQASKPLRTFVYEVNRRSEHNYSMPKIREALTLNQQILENLWLDLADGSPSLPSGDLSRTSSLSSFTVLKNLWVGMLMFFGPEYYDRSHALDLASLLPASIETLYFPRTKGRVHRLTSALEKLLQTRESHTPKLRMIAFEADVTGVYKTFDFSRLDCVAKALGVEIVRIDCIREERRQDKDGSLDVSCFSD